MKKFLSLCVFAASTLPTDSRIRAAVKPDCSVQKKRAPDGDSGSSVIV